MNDKYRFPVFIMVIMYLSVTGCASTGSRLDKVTEAEKTRVLSGSALSDDLMLLSILPDEDVMGLTEEMKQFVNKAVSGHRDQNKKLQALLDDIVSPAKLGLKYDDTATYTASETFEFSRANCLSFTTMIVSMLRYLGLQVEFNDVEVPPVWDLQNQNMLVLYRHVNSIVTWSDGSREVVDFNLEEYNLNYPQRGISDATAMAQYFNNRGMEFLFQDNFNDAFRYLRKALNLAPDISFLWINLGTLYRKRGLLEEAEIAYRMALELDPTEYVAMSNIERVYRELGLMELAEEFGQRVKYFRQRNPYYLYTLAMDSFQGGDYETAFKHIRDAIRRYDKEHRFYFLQGAIYKALDRPEQASVSFDKAVELTSNQKQLDKYRRKIEALR